MYIILYWHLWKCKRYNLSLELITYWRRIKKTFGKCTELCLTFLPHKDDEQLSDKCFLVCLHSKKSGLDLADDKIYKAKSLASFFFGNLKYACSTINCKHWTSLLSTRSSLVFLIILETVSFKGVPKSDSSAVLPPYNFAQLSVEEAFAVRTSTQGTRHCCCASDAQCIFSCVSQGWTPRWKACRKTDIWTDCSPSVRGSSCAS